MNALFPSVLRTAVPLLAGWILTGTGALGIEADSVAVAGGVTTAVTLAYYVLFRLTELGAARIGWEPLRLVAGLLLGWARPPKYPSTKATSVDIQLDPVQAAEILRAVRRGADGRP
ncbi:MAG TPA: hypothetical protein VIP77_00030 [Jiangellaceae bacterium]